MQILLSEIQQQNERKYKKKIHIAYKWQLSGRTTSTMNQIEM